MKQKNHRTGREPHVTTRLAEPQVEDLCQQIHESTNGNLPVAGSRRLGLYQGTRLVPINLRHNLEQEFMAELFGISQPTVSRILSAYTPLVAEALKDNAPAADDLDPDVQLNVDGTLAPWPPAGPGVTGQNSTRASTTPRREPPGRLHPGLSE